MVKILFGNMFWGFMIKKHKFHASKLDLENLWLPISIEIHQNETQNILHSNSTGAKNISYEFDQPH